jgi:hypothetical protein
MLGHMQRKVYWMISLYVGGLTSNMHELVGTIKHLGTTKHLVKLENSEAECTLAQQ